MELILYEKNPGVATALRNGLAAHGNVCVRLGAFEDGQPFDGFVTAGNSFGLMDGGVDRAVVQYFGREIEERVQAVILDQYLGEQPVGSCLLIETGRIDRPYLAHAPIMRVPMNISGTDNVYLAFWSALLAIRRHNASSSGARVQKVASVGLGTGTGGMDPTEAALQMALAWRHLHEPPARITPGLARTRCDSTLGIAIGSPEWAAELRDAFSRPRAFSSRVVGQS